MSQPTPAIKELSSHSQMSVPEPDEDEDNKDHPVPYFRNPAPRFTALTVLDLLQDEELLQSIVSFSEQLDQVLEGGVSLARITELCGMPGSGKTQMCLQLAVSVQIPQCYGGVEGQCLYIDTEQTFFLERFQEIATGAMRHCTEVCDGSEEQVNASKNFTVDSILTGIHYVKCLDSVHLISLIESLPDVVKDNPKIKLVVVDSIAGPMRSDYDDYSMRSRVLAGLAQILILTAVKGKLAVVMTNHLTTKLNTDRTLSNLVPALGESWGHVCGTRLLLERVDENHSNDSNHQRDSIWTATVLKSSTVGAGEIAHFDITQNGIRDISDDRGSNPDGNSSSLPKFSTSQISDSEMMKISSRGDNGGGNDESRMECGMMMSDDSGMDTGSQKGGNSSESSPPNKRQRVETRQKKLE